MDVRPLRPTKIDVIRKKRTRWRLHMEGQVPVSEILEALGKYSGVIELEEAYIDVRKERGKRRRENTRVPPLYKAYAKRWPEELRALLLLGEERTIFRMRVAEQLLEITEVERFPLENVHYLSGFTLDFERGRLCKPLPNPHGRKLLCVPPRVPREKSLELLESGD